MRLLIAGGGTGGHLYPGIAVAEELLSRGGGHAVFFAVTERGLEQRVLPEQGLPFATVRAAGLVGQGLRRAARSLWLLALGFSDALGILRRFRPSACLGVGGYVSFPVVALARLLGVPTAIQEQNAWPGLANRLLARSVRRVYAGDPAAVPHLPRTKTRVTGNPLRRAFGEPFPYVPPREGEPPRLLVLGGSQGARSLNVHVPAAVAGLGHGLEVWHQTGRGQRDSVAQAYGTLGGVRVVEFIDDVADAYRWAHLVIARAGALTVAELAGSGRPAILVPFPFSAGGHQDANAAGAEERGAAVAMRDSEVDAPRLAARLSELLGEPERLARMARKAADGARPGAARAIVDDMLGMAGRGA